jgi:hypothetical protein
MTPQEKADELVTKILKQVGYDTDIAVPCALIAVDEIINSSPSLPILGDSGSYGEDIELSKIYWEEVKQEIKNI